MTCKPRQIIGNIFNIARDYNRYCGRVIGNLGSLIPVIGWILDLVKQDSTFTCAAITRTCRGYVTDGPSATEGPVLITGIPSNIPAITGGRYIDTTAKGASAGDSLWDADASAFVAGTYSWTPYGTNTIANVDNSLEVTYGNNGSAAQCLLKDASDLSSDLTIGNIYKITAEYKVNAGATVFARVWDGETWVVVSAAIASTSFITIELYFKALSATACSLAFAGLGAGEKVYIKNQIIQEITPKFLTTDTSGSDLSPSVSKSTPSGTVKVFTAFPTYAAGAVLSGDQVAILTSTGNRVYMTAQADDTAISVTVTDADIGSTIADAGGFNWLINGYATIEGQQGEAEVINYLLNADVPVTQTTESLGTGTYTLQVFGSGSALASAGTATITGESAATEGSINTITVTVAGTVTITVTGSLDYFQLEGGNSPTSLIITAGTKLTRAGTAESISTTGLITATSGAIKIVATLPFGNQTFARLFSMYTGANDYFEIFINSGAVFARNMVGGVAADINSTFIFSDGITGEVDVRWDGTRLYIRGKDTGEADGAWLSVVEARDINITTTAYLGGRTGLSNIINWNSLSFIITGKATDLGWCSGLWCGAGSLDSIWTGKDILWTGTSIPFLGKPAYPVLVAESGDAIIDNESVGSSRITLVNADPNPAAPLALSGTQAEIIAHPQYVAGQEVNSYEVKIIGKGADLLIIDHGHNDDAPIGTISDMTHETFYGAYNIVIAAALADNPLLTIMLVTPIKKWFIAGESASIVAKQQAIIAVGVSHGLKVIDPIADDLFTELGYPPYFPDDVHPNQNGIQIMAEYLVSKI